jgi:hypothetical protein
MSRKPRRVAAPAVRSALTIRSIPATPIATNAAAANVADLGSVLGLSGDAGAGLLENNAELDRDEVSESASRHSNSPRPAVVRACSASTTSPLEVNDNSAVSATLSPAPIVDACRSYGRLRAETVNRRHELTPEWRGLGRKEFDRLCEEASGAFGIRRNIIGTGWTRRHNSFATASTPQNGGDALESRMGRNESQ